jgi:hypothetical protein
MNEGEPIKITPDDIEEANRLSLGCPICASAVQDNVEAQALKPVICSNCQTLYHATCWEQNGGKCATLGCGSTESYPYGTEVGPRLKIRYSDLPKHAPQAPSSPNGRQKELNEQQKRLQERARGREFWSNLYGRIKRAFGWQ